MDTNFEVVNLGDLSLLVYKRWWEEGIVHGMTLRPYTLGSGVRDEGASRLCRALGASLLANPRQTHGDLCFDARDAAALKAQRATDGSLTRFGEYDALIAPAAQNLSLEKVVYAIATADCVPVVMRGASGWGLVHAGWRGLANGVIERSARTLGSVQGAVVFACAGGGAYEVGREVVDAIGPSASYRVTPSGAIFLDTAETARRQLGVHVAAERIETSGICTIEDSRFHSYRRDGAQAGRSLTFVLPPLLTY